MESCPKWFVGASACAISVIVGATMTYYVSDKYYAPRVDQCPSYSTSTCEDRSCQEFVWSTRTTQTGPCVCRHDNVTFCADYDHSRIVYDQTYLLVLIVCAVFTVCSFVGVVTILLRVNH